MSAECQLCDLTLRTTVHDAGDSQREHTMTVGPAGERRMETEVEQAAGPGHLAG